MIKKRWHCSSFILFQLYSDIQQMDGFKNIKRAHLFQYFNNFKDVFTAFIYIKPLKMNSLH